MILAARLREALGLPGMTVEQTVPFRDKETMKQVLDAAGIRTPRHARATSAQEVWQAAEKIGYPLIVKPIAGAGSIDTHRVDDAGALEKVIKSIGHVPEVSVEEFIDAEEFTYDTVCIGTEIAFENVCWYRPRPLIDKQVEWISPQTVALRDLTVPDLQDGIEMGHQVLRALSFTTGFTHMEWYRRSDGEVVFGEIAARAAGARTVDVMNFANDIDLYRGWAEVMVHGQFTQPVERKYNAASVFKRAQGQGRIQRIEGLDHLRAEFGEHICCVDLLPIGAPRRDWRQVIIGDGLLIVRHYELDQCLHMAERIGRELHIYAG